MLFVSFNIQSLTDVYPACSWHLGLRRHCFMFRLNNVVCESMAEFANDFIRIFLRDT